MTSFLISILGANYRLRLIALIQLLAVTGWNYFTSLAPGATFDYKTFFTSLVGAVILFFTKGVGVTGGTIPATDEAKARVVAPTPPTPPTT